MLPVASVINKWDGTECWCHYIGQGKAEVLGENPAAPQIPQRLARAWTLASAVKGRQLIAWATKQLLVLFSADVYVWDTCVIGAVKSILIAAANESVIHQTAVIYLSSLSFRFLLQSCRRYQSTVQELAEEAYKMAVVWEGDSDVPTGRHLSHTLRV